MGFTPNQKSRNCICQSFGCTCAAIQFKVKIGQIFIPFEHLITSGFPVKVEFLFPEKFSLLKIKLKGQIKRTPNNSFCLRTFEVLNFRGNVKFGVLGKAKVFFLLVNFKIVPFQLGSFISPLNLYLIIFFQQKLNFE